MLNLNHFSFTNWLFRALIAPMLKIRQIQLLTRKSGWELSVTTSQRDKEQPAACFFSILGRLTKEPVLPLRFLHFLL